MNQFSLFQKNLVKNLGWLAAWSLSVGMAVAATPTAQQLEMFKNLTPSQQEALARQYGVDLAQLKAQADQSGSTQQVSPSLNELVPARGATDAAVQAMPYGQQPIGQGQSGSGQAGFVSQQQGFQPQQQQQGFQSQQQQGFQPQPQQQGFGQQRFNGEGAPASVDGLQQPQQPEPIQGRASLKPFGYDLFAGSPSTFAPVTDVPVPANYIMGPGDQIRVQLYGKEANQFELTVDRKGEVAFPGIGPLVLAGMNYQEMTEYLTTVVSERMIGNRASISMGALRSVRVFVLGEAYRPGSYTVSSLSTVTHAIFAAGGIKEIGSLRNIQLKRQGQVVATLDLYDLLLRGDTSADISLLPGDVVFIPTLGKTAGIAGEVLRPAMYELKGEQSSADLLKLAGGLLPTAYPAASRLERIESSGAKTLLDLDLAKPAGLNVTLRKGDVIQVYSVLDQIDNIVQLHGHVQRPGGFGWRAGMRISDMLPDLRELLPNPDLNYGVIRRETMPTREIEVIAFNPGKAITQRQSAYDLQLQPRDKVFVFSSQMQRDMVMQELLTQLRSQARFMAPPQIVSIQGSVRFPGVYPLTRQMTLQQLLEAAFDLDQFAERNYVLLANFDSVQVKTTVRVVSLDNPQDLQTRLSALDEVYVLSRNESRAEVLAGLNQRLMQQADKNVAQQVVTVSGDVRFPGIYPLTSGMNAADLIKVAGGYNESSYVVSGEITRRSTDGSATSELEHFSLELAKAQELALMPQDTLLIKRIPEWRESNSIELLGEVKFPGTYQLKRGEKIADVIARAGGFTEYADVNAAVFSRQSIKDNEKRQIQQAQNSLKQEIAAKQLSGNASDNKAPKTAEEAEQLIAQLNAVDPIGRMVIDLPAALEGSDLDNLELENGDRLAIPSLRRSITVIGEVQQPTSHTYNRKLDLNSYLERSGGLKARADKKRIYIVKANGSVLMPKNNWFDNGRAGLEAGDTIVVPLDSEYMNGLQTWSSATQILYNTAVAIAALGTFI